MFYEFLYPLVRYFTPFNIFQYITFRSAYAAVTSLLICFLFGPRFIQLIRRNNDGEQIRVDGPETHQVKVGTPTMGGVMIILSTVTSVILWQDIRSSATWIALLALVGFGLVGFCDDYIKVFRKKKSGLSTVAKLTGQLVVAAAVAVAIYLRSNPHTTLLYVPMFKDPLVDLSWFYIPFSMILLVGYTNAVNLTDGLDGLATGLVIMVGLTFAVLAYLVGRVDYSAYLQIPFIADAGELTVFSLALVGACVGFLWYNSHPAEIYMGDTGSLALGGVLGAVALMIKKELLLFIVGGVFVIETASVILQVVRYKTQRKRFFLMAPLHHHFELKGWSESKVVLRFWILGGLFAILSLSTLKIR